MKAIVTKQDHRGFYDEVGMNNRTVISYNTVQTLNKKARAYGNGAKVRVEIMSFNFYAPPAKVYYL